VVMSEPKVARMWSRWVMTLESGVARIWLWWGALMAQPLKPQFLGLISVS